MGDELSFRTDLFRGTASFYDRFRLSDRFALIADLIDRVRPDGSGRLLDLACATGQIAFALRHEFREVWAVDQEADMIDFAAAEAAQLGVGH